MFSEIALEDEDHTFYEREYSFCIVPGGWKGGTDQRVLEVFYGARPYEAYRNQPVVPKKEVSGGNATQTGFFTEAGARLVYGRTAKGTVNCTLMPAQTDVSRLTEKAFMLTRGVEPRELLQGALPRKHWRSFMSYMKVTSLDGDPSFVDRMRIAYMFFAKRRYLDGKVSPPMWMAGCQVIGKWIFTVALSGALLTLITMYFSNNTVTLDPGSASLLRSLVEADKNLNLSVELANTTTARLSALLQSASNAIRYKPDHASKGNDASTVGRSSAKRLTSDSEGKQLPPAK